MTLYSKTYCLNHLASHPSSLYIVLVCQQLAFSPTTISTSLNTSRLQAAPGKVLWSPPWFPRCRVALPVLGAQPGAAVGLSFTVCLKSDNLMRFSVELVWI